MFPFQATKNMKVFKLQHNENILVTFKDNSTYLTIALISQKRKYLLNSLPKDSLFALSASYRCFPSFIKAPAHYGKENT